MIGLDTNVLVRYFAQDDAHQSAAANQLMATLTKEKPGYVSLVTLCELAWVLEGAYAQKKAQLLDLLQSMMESDELHIESKATAWSALAIYRDSVLDFSDAVILKSGADAGCMHTVTFDKAAAKTAGFVLLKSR